MSPSATIILTAALLPAVILLIIILIRDKENPEPAPLLAKGVLYGVLSVFGSLTLHGLMWDAISRSTLSSPVIQQRFL